MKYKGKQELVINAYVDADFLPATGIQLLQGENFFSGTPGGGEGIIVNEAFLKEFNIESPIETVLSFPWEKDSNQAFGTRKIRGVVKDFHFGSLHKAVAPFMLQNSNSTSQLYIRIASGEESEAIVNIKKVYQRLIPDHPFQYRFMEDVNAQQYENEARWKEIITLASVFAIFISCIGLFGLSRLTTEQRTKEISIRRVNGGKVSEIMSMLNKDFLKWVFIAFILACPFAWFAVNRWLQNFAYRIEISWCIFAFAGLLALIIAMITVSWQSWKAATRNPVEALRRE